MTLLDNAYTPESKLDYDTLVRERIAGPLSMSVTSVTVDPSLANRLATGHTVEGEKPAPTRPWTWNASSALTGAGGLRSSARDMIRYLAANTGQPDSPLKVAMKQAQRPRAEAGSSTMAIGLAWHLKRSGERMLVWHNGGTGGFHSFCGFDPIRGEGVVVLVNSTESIDDIGFHLLEPSEPLATVSTPIVVDEAKLARLDGFYDLGGATLHVTHEGQQLYAQLTGQARYPVFPKSETLFFYRVVAAELEFEVEADGSVNQVTLHQAGRHMPARRVPAGSEPKARVEVPVDPRQLAEYAGTYQLAGAALAVRVKDGHLEVQLTGQPPLDAYPESDTEFFLKVVDAQLRFVRDAAGRVDAVILHQGGIDQRAPRAN
jgi:hypothetical protein